MKYRIITFGCQMNKSDSERIATVLENMGYRQTLNEGEADLIVVNMCSVRQSAVDRVYGLIPKFKKIKTLPAGRQVKTILTGCVLKEDKKKFKKGFDLILNIRDLPSWPLMLKNYPAGAPNQGLNYLEIRPKYQNDFSAFVPISNGCNNACSYCVVPFVRGSLICRNHKEIIKETKNAIKQGFREIWLLGQNVNDYTSPADSSVTEPRRDEGGDEGKLRRRQTSSINFAKLLELVNDIPGDFQIRFISPNPKNFSDELIEVMAKSKKVAKYLNLPVQSGDNEILKRMNRPYTIEQYKNLVKKIREKIPDINLSTDVIVGFPGETKKQFENTVKLFKEIKFNIAYFAKYSPRPGTAAWQMKDDVPWKEKRRREKILREIIGKYA